MENDFYCNEVLNGKTPVDVVLETENVLAFRHTRPKYAFHVVVIPKRHVASLLSLDEGERALTLELIDAVRRAAATALEQTGACKVVTNLGAYQDSKHLHWHVVSGDMR